MTKPVVAPVDVILLTLTGVKTSNDPEIGAYAVKSGRLATTRSTHEFAHLLTGVNQLFAKANVRFILRGVRSQDFAVATGAPVIDSEAAEPIISWLANQSGITLACVAVTKSPDAGYSAEEQRVTVLSDAADVGLLAHEFGHLMSLDHPSGGLMAAIQLKGSRIPLTKSQAIDAYNSPNARKFGAGR